MGIDYGQTKMHWNYFLALEQDFQVISRFIEPCDENSDVFSLELARIIMASAQEVDVVMKNLCKLYEDFDDGGIAKYLTLVDKYIPELKEEAVIIPRFGMESRPWSTWGEGAPPLWWTANNKIKHHRREEYNRATLKNAFNSLSALLIVTMYFYRKEAEMETGNTDISWMEITNSMSPDSTLFRLQEGYYYREVYAEDFITDL